jgi:hypothetical protein
MKLRIHTCKATGCQHVISTRLLMCLEHWRLVPASLKREVQQLARQVQVDGHKVSNGWVAFDQYKDAVRRAVAAVEEKQERKAEGPSGSLFT